ncbi:hypothetical protein BDZ94DRAFT_1254436 [Collybia nuda]|uniref:Uncharacterized protein n=1 Tax=Collybia nuda TaxID=64659 RepID=A0A9P5Y889_9AGAR|nr:hypothetical protein BDZ94DRAFT_1254436 [Collybia nuda]
MSLDQLVLSLDSTLLNTKLALACALPIIAEHLSVIWSFLPISAEFIPSTITLYQCSPSHSNVLAAVKNTLSEYENQYTDLHQYGEEQLSQKLLLVIMDNRLDKSGL